MPVQFVSHYYSNKLGNPGEKQVGMKRFLIPGFTTGNTKTVFEVVDGFFNIYSDFVGGIPFPGATDGSGISAKVLFRINVDHPSAGRSGAWMITVAYAFGFLCGAVPFPIHFGAYEFHGRKPAAQMGSASLTLHGKGGVMRTAGNAVIIYGILEERKKYERNRSRRRSQFLDADYICCSNYGKPRSKDFHWRHYKELLQKAGLPDIRWHDLRSTYCTLLLKQDFNPKAVSKLM